MKKNEILIKVTWNMEYSMKFESICGKVGTDMLHKNVLDWPVTFVTFFACHAGVYHALDFRRNSVYRRRFSTPNGSVNHIMVLPQAR